MRGELDWSIKAFHDQYGPVVRFSPEELSFISDQAWKDIYNPRINPLVKDPLFYDVVKLGSDGATSIFNADPTSHPRIRKGLAHAFSEKALRDQEPRIEGYLNLLITKLRQAAAAESSVDMVKWYNFLTFDLIGDLALGKSFDCLKSSKYHNWVNGIWKSIKIGPYIRTMATYTNVERLVRLLAPKSIRQARLNHELYVHENTRERVAKGVMEDRKDFLSYILGNQGQQEPLTEKQIAANCGFLIMAGSETTATALSGTTYHLLKTPEALAKATQEVRSAFTSEEEINFVNAAARLPYLLACLNEGLRLYPPGPTLAPRRTPRERMTVIDGYEVPPWITVGVHSLSATRSPSNFHLPLSFAPERWLPSSYDNPSSPFHHDRRGASQPFSLGARNCLGKSLAYNEMRVVLARVLWNFDLDLLPESGAWHHQLSYTLWEKPALMCRLRDARGK